MKKSELNRLYCGKLLNTFQQLYKYFKVYLVQFNKSKKFQEPKQSFCHHFYADIPVYQAKNLKKEQITVDIAASFAQAKVPPPHSFSFLEAIIYEGKQLYLMEKLLSLTPMPELQLLSLIYNGFQKAIVFDGEVTFFNSDA